jgi:Ca2+-binding EF-hand superfamily protein
MRTKTLIATAVAAALAFPLAAVAGGDKKAGASESSAAATQAKSNDGAEAMFQSLDKNKDGSLSKDEAKGTPHEKDFAKLDKDSDGKLSREEHAAAPEHAGKSGSSASATSAPTADAKKKY